MRLSEGAPSTTTVKPMASRCPTDKLSIAAVREACKLAGISPEQIQYVEAHRTGTPVGDPIEANAVGNAIGKNRPAEDDCTIG
jgi:acyl transferase domain-containing protein